MAYLNGLRLKTHFWLGNLQQVWQTLGPSRLLKFPPRCQPHARSDSMLGRRVSAGSLLKLSTLVLVLADFCKFQSYRSCERLEHVELDVHR